LVGAFRRNRLGRLSAALLTAYRYVAWRRWDGWRYLEIIMRGWDKTYGVEDVDTVP
jgi:hypothetical protein